jgi:anti-sigma factor RsiW
VTGHHSLDELSDWAADGLEPGRAAEVGAHVESCPDCAEEVAALREVTQLLAAAPVPAMPADVFGRLSGVVAAESQRRSAAAHRRAQHGPGHGAAGLLADPRPTLGSFDARTKVRRPARVLGRVLVSLGVAAAVGFGGYVLSATAGLNEPVASTPVSINPATLSKQAAALRLTSPSNPHRFSNAWQCARKVTDGRIVGIRSVTVTGEPAYLVYLDRDDSTEVDVVRGCGTGTPVVGPSAQLPKR